MTALKKGFTLIELLIVIAILGVLAVVVLVAINPVQQLARTRDSGRISTVSQLGHAIEAYYTSHNGTYPTVVQWNADVLTTAGEINQLPGLVTNSLTSECATNNVDGWCYNTNTTDFILFSRLEADTNMTLGTCAGAEAYAVYSSAEGRACIHCNSVPAVTGPTCQN